jgi:hypothetical protein
MKLLHGLLLRLFAAKAVAKLTKAIAVAMVLSISFSPFSSFSHPKVIVISLDGATPRLLNRYLAEGALPEDQGVGLLRRQGVFALFNKTVSPSLTAPGQRAPRYPSK